MHCSKIYQTSLCPFVLDFARIDVSFVSLSNKIKMYTQIVCLVTNFILKHVSSYVTLIFGVRSSASFRDKANL